jgi:hypothetical protein
MSKQSSFSFAIGTVAVGILLAVAAAVYGFRLSDSDGQKLGGVATAVGAVAGFIGLVVLVVYTREAFLLRKVAEEQNEGNIRPIVRLDFHSTNDKSTDPTLDLVFRLENVGIGPALRADAPTPAPDASTPRVPREFSKQAIVRDLLIRAGDATLQEIVEKTGWQKHTVRGFISTLTKKTGIAITSTRRESDKARVYEAAK